jgi:TetR/AcrR family transcriptional repressor of nem operon
MLSNMSTTAPALPNARAKLLDAAVNLVRRGGFAATSIDDLCAAAGVTKGAFFHHFAGKEDLGVEVANHWRTGTSQLFAQAPYHRHRDPLARILAYLDFRKALLHGSLPEYSCLVGTLVQEVYDSHPRIRQACDASIHGHASTLVADIAAAMKTHKVASGWTAESLALHTQVVLQGAFVVAKARDDRRVAIDAVDHLKRYVRSLFGPKKKKAPKP